MAAYRYSGRHFCEVSPHPMPSHDSTSLCTVKVENLAKSTTEEDLRKRLEEFTFASVRVLQCPAAPVNYAYLNCIDQGTARSVVNKVNGKMLVHNTLLRAKLKLQGSQVNHCSKPLQPKPKDICAVKVLIQDFQLTGPDLDHHFRQFGELSSPTIIRPGTPIYAYINFVNPHAAQEARSNPTYMINGKSVIVVPFKTSKYALPTNPTQDLVSLDFPCDPLAIENAKRELLQDFKDKQMMKIEMKGEKFIVHAQGAIADLVKKQIQSTIKSHESCLESKMFQLEFHFLPLLADQEAWKQIHAIKIPFELKVLQGHEKVDLNKLATDFTSRGSGPLEEKKLQHYLTLPSTADATSVTYRWYWFDDTTVQPYQERVSECIERKFKMRTKFELSIGKFTYTIDPVRMIQTNKSTQKQRKIERRLGHSSPGIHHMTLTIRAHKDHTPELQREIKEILSKMIHEEKVVLPDLATQEEPFTDHLLEMAKRNFVKATLIQDGILSVILRGKELLVKNTEVNLQSEILKKERAVEKFSVPSHWVTQVKQCELKEVTPGTSEWKEVRDKMHRSEFAPQIIKVERIQNKWLWESYQMALKRMSDKNSGTVNEKMLFHGTRHTSPKEIYDSEQGFDHRLASKGLWGEGTYFAVEPKYSDKYTYQLSSRTKQMFLAKVITGISCSCVAEDRTLKAPPKKSEHKTRNPRISIAAKFEGERYDSVTGHTNGSQVYVVYELGRVYPAYLITYSTSTCTYDF